MRFGLAFAFVIFALLLDIRIRYNAHYTSQLVIGIPSARHHFALRKALRRTWVGAIRDSPSLNQRVLVKFIVGSTPCSIHPLLRQTPYVCRQSSLDYPILKGDVLSHQHIENHTEFKLITSSHPVGIDFQVNFPVILKGLGVFDESGNGLSSNLSVILYDTTTQKEITTLEFTPDDPGYLVNNYRFKLLTTHLVIPKDYQATLAAKGFSSDDPCMIVSEQINTGRGVVTFSKVFRFSSHSSGFPDMKQTLLTHGSLSAAALLFEPNIENESVINFPLGTDDEDEWARHLEDESHQLEEEILAEGDILTVDVVDVYRNITLKMLHFYQWLSQSVDFDVFLKTDDDTFLNIEEITKHIDLHHMEDLSKVWWGNFRSQWGVEKFGKWAEFDYLSSVYPTFACGSGYTLSRDLVDWIALNAGSLKPYQGEDVSMGIWLAAVSPTIVKDSRWQCFNTCAPEMLALPEQSPETLLSLWTNKVKCSNLCNCSVENERG